jgi:cellulose biosynthesis protein BcsQ
MQTPRPPGTICTFYSFKGGVGRSMAAANVAALLSKGGHRVLLVDFDLEAPGIEHYFTRYGFRSPSDGMRGVVDLVRDFAAGTPGDWASLVCTASPFGSAGERLSILPAGRRGRADRTYLSRLQSLNWPDLFANRGFGEYLEQVRAEWIDRFDFVLVDSRTGYTDSGGICTIQLPDVLVTLLTTNDQNLQGTVDVVKDVRDARDQLPLDRGHLYVLPVPSRVESWTEYSSAREWHQKFQEALGPLIEEWLPRPEVAGREIHSRDVLDQVTLPYVAYWSFGEGLPVVEEGTEGKLTLGRAYGYLAALIERRLDYVAAVAAEPAVQAVSGTRTVVEQAEAAYARLTPEERRLADAAFARMVVDASNPDLPVVTDSLDLQEFLQLRPVLEKLAAAGVVELKGDRAFLGDEVLRNSWPRLRTDLEPRVARAISQLRQLGFRPGTGQSRGLLWLRGGIGYRELRLLLGLFPEALSRTERAMARSLGRLQTASTLGFVALIAFVLFERQTIVSVAQSAVAWVSRLFF